MYRDAINKINLLKQHAIKAIENYRITKDVLEIKEIKMEYAHMIHYLKLTDAGIEITQLEKELQDIENKTNIA